MRDKLIEIIRSVPITDKTYADYVEAVASQILFEFTLFPVFKIEPPPKPPIYKQDLAVLHLTRGVENALRRSHINTVGELCHKTMREVLRVRGIGKGALSYIQRVLEQHDLMLRFDYSHE